MTSTRPQTRFRWTGIAALLGALAGWSLVPLFLRHFVEHIDVWTSNGWRYGFSALIWLPVLLPALRRGRVSPRIFVAAIIPGLVNTLGQVFFAWAHYKIDPGLVTFGLRAHIVFVALGALAIFPAERRVIASRSFIVGVLIVTLGTSLTLIMAEDFGSRTGVFGIVLALLAGAGFAGYALSIRACMSAFPAIESFAVISLYTAAITVGLMLVLGKIHGLGAIAMPGTEFALLLLSALIGIAFGHVLYYIAIARLGVAISSGVLQLQPVCVSIGSLMLFGERLSPAQWTAGIIAVFGAFIVLRAQQHAAAHDPELPTDADEFLELPPDHVAASVASELVGDTAAPNTTGAAQRE